MLDGPGHSITFITANRRPEVLTRIAQYELAYRMRCAPELTDLSRTETYSEMYGPDVKSQHVCRELRLLARRLAERNVFITYHMGWDHATC